MKILNIKAFKEAIEKAIDDNVSLVVNFTTLKATTDDKAISVGMRCVPYNYDGRLEGILYKKYIDGGLYKFDFSYGTFPLEITVSELVKIFKVIETKDYIRGVLVAVYNSLSITNREIIDTNLESVKDLEHSAFYDVTYYDNDKSVVVNNIYGEHISTIELYKSFEIHVNDIDYPVLNNLVSSGYGKVFSSYDSNSEERAITAMRNKLGDQLTVIHLAHYDAWCIVENKVVENLKRNNRPLNIQVPENEVMHVIGRAGNNINTIINRYGLPKISVQGVAIKSYTE